MTKMITKMWQVYDVINSVYRALHIYMSSKIPLPYVIDLPMLILDLPTPL